MTGFDADWLGLREAYDHRARSGDLARRFADALPAAPRLVDLAAGTGSNARYLQGVGRMRPDWLLVDSDRALLGAVRGVARARRRAFDLACGIAALDLGAVDGITSAAFCDLVSAAWIDAVAARAARFRLPLLIALTVDGRLDLHPEDADDLGMLTRYRRHQRRDKGFGPALGGGAPRRLCAALRRHGYRVEMRRSDWRLAGSDGPLLRLLVDGMAAAAAAAAPNENAVAEAWRLRRQRLIEGGNLRLRVGHTDCFAAMAIRNDQSTRVNLT